MNHRDGETTEGKVLMITDPSVVHLLSGLIDSTLTEVFRGALVFEPLVGLLVMRISFLIR
jgi:hypothetical protein